jgi:heptosyltransferase-2
LADSPASVFLRLPNWVGDLVMVTPAIRAVRRHWPGARIVAGLRRYGRPVLDGLDTVDEFWELDGLERLGRRLPGYARRLRAARFDVAVFFTNSLTSVLGPALARIPERIGYEGDWRGALLTRRAPREDRRAPVPMPRYYLDLVRFAGVPDAGDHYDVPVRPRDRDEAEALLSALGVGEGRPIAAINPGAKFGSSKLWSLDRFAEIGDRLAAAGFQVLVLCAPGEADMARRIARRMRATVASTHDRIIPLSTLRAVVARLALLVTTDTGPRHVAAGLGVPTVVVMGSTHPTWTAWSLDRTRVVRRDVPCGPCHLRRCPLDHACMDLVTADEVWEAIGQVLRSDPARAGGAISHGSSHGGPDASV